MGRHNGKVWVMHNTHGWGRELMVRAGDGAGNTAAGAITGTRGPRNNNHWGKAALSVITMGKLSSNPTMTLCQPCAEPCAKPHQVCNEGGGSGVFPQSPRIVENSWIFTLVAGNAGKQVLPSTPESLGTCNFA